MTYATANPPMLDTVNHYAGVEQGNTEAAIIADGYRALAHPQGYPPGIIAQARHAVASEAAARDAYQAKERQAKADIAQDELWGDEASYHLKRTCGAAWRALQAAEKATAPALRALGAAVQDIDTQRTEINGLPLEEDAEEQRHQAAKVRFETRRLTALAALQRYGVSE